MSNISFCPNCNNILDITKSSKQAGGAKDEESTDSDSSTHSDHSDTFIQKILHNHKIDDTSIDTINFDDLLKSDEYKNLSVENKELVYNKIQDLKPTDIKKTTYEKNMAKTSEKAYFICDSCGYLKPIDDGTLIFSRVSNDIVQHYASSEVNDMQYSSILPRTRKYICPNTKCISHTDDSKREAVFFRLNNSYRVKYICLPCGTVF